VPLPPAHFQKINGPYLLVTTGGGGDGEAVVDWVLRAYEHDKTMPLPALLVLGPFMQSERQVEFLNRAARLKKVEAITFDAQLETLMDRAAGVVGMGGYNTFCEILSFDKRALIIPRTVPRREQYIRATRAEELGLCRVLIEDEIKDPRVMATALRHLPQQQLPSQSVVPGLLDGQENVDRLVDKWLARGRRPQLALARRRARR
jgi:predicted glycosyltransferase